MAGLTKEINNVVQNNYVLSFLYPTHQQIEKMRRINRDISDVERRALEEKIKITEELLNEIGSGEIPPEALRPETIEQLRALLTRRR
jgi:superfamily I DNA and RNA helicase